MMRSRIHSLLVVVFLLVAMLVFVPSTVAHDTEECELAPHYKQLKVHVFCEDRDRADDHCTLSAGFKSVKAGFQCAE